MEPVGTFGEIRIKINLTIAVLSIAIGAGLIMLYTLYPAQKDLLVFCAAVIAGVTGIYSAFYVGQTLRTQIERDKLHRSFELTGEYTSIDFTKIRDFIETNVNYKQMAPDDIYKKITTDESLHHAVKMALNWFERVSIAIQNGYVDEGTLYTSLAYILPFYFKSLGPFIQQTRTSLKDNLLYFELEKLNNAWMSQRYLSTGKTIKAQS